MTGKPPSWRRTTGKGMCNVTHSVYELAEYIQARCDSVKRAEELLVLLEMVGDKVNEGAKEPKIPVADHTFFVQETKSG